MIRPTKEQIDEWRRAVVQLRDRGSVTGIVSWAAMASGLLAEVDALTARAEAAEQRAAGLEGALTKISAIRDSIVGMQGFNFSEHAYPLVAALEEAGFEGAGYQIARQNLGTLVEQRDAAEKRAETAEQALAEVGCALREDLVTAVAPARCDGWAARWERSK